MCVSAEFVDDNSVDPDCLDRTDENDGELLKIYRAMGFFNCLHDPAFRCEESGQFHGYRNLGCGDGQQLQLGSSGKMIELYLRPLDKCENHRNYILLQSVILESQKNSNLTSECWELMTCLTLQKSNFLCTKDICPNGSLPCSVSISEACNQSDYVIFPVLPILQAYGEFGYWTNRTIVYNFSGEIPLPDFVCYDRQYCPFFPLHFKIQNLTCLDIKTMGFIKSDDLIRLFHTCLSVDKYGNETDCFHSSLFHCPNTSKCIPKHRLLDGVKDCVDGADETDIDSCQLNNTYRFRCSSEDKCLSPILVNNMADDCHGGEDEISYSERDLSFQNICDGYEHVSAMIIDGKNETDEKNCEQWPCNNQYTQCDGVWKCANGIDEVNCHPESPCYPDQHQCISPINFTLMCLPVHRAGNGEIDCLGAVDERQHCRDKYPKNTIMRYRCLNDTKCTIPDWSGLKNCPFEQNLLINEIYPNDTNFNAMFESLRQDFYFANDVLRIAKHFMLGNTSRFSLKASSTHSTVTQKSLLIPIAHFSDIDNDSSPELLPNRIDSRQAWICNRGILIFIGIEKTEHCLCPPSYYGNRCEFQNQRVSLTLQFSKECESTCHGLYGIVVMLIDDDQVIHSHEQLIYSPTHNCDMKYNIYLLYRSRVKDPTKHYIIRIDAYDKINLAYHNSWMLPVNFLILPVNRVAAHLNISAYPNDTIYNREHDCGQHGRCATYKNTGEHFCRCESDWSGVHCTNPVNNSDCSPDSIFLGRVNNRSICLCRPHKSGPRCFLHSVCRDDPCKNDGQCVQEDHQLSMNMFTCICSAGFSGKTCEDEDTRIDISFKGVDIPQSLLIHFITVQDNGKPLIITILKKVAFDQDTTTLYTSVLFNLIFIQIFNDFYLAFLQVKAVHVANVALKMKSFHHCSSIEHLLDKQTLDYPLLRRAKSYHIACREHSQLSCFSDNKAFMCLCNEDGYANCFPFDFNKTSTCPGRKICENGGQCLQDRADCPTSTICICEECFYGGKCQFTTKSFGLSLDVILAYQVRSHVPVLRQSASVKMSIGLTIVMLITGLINGLLSGMTFQSKQLREYGCGYYLFTLSIMSFLSATFFTLKFWFLLLSQTAWLKNRNFLSMYCFSLDFILQSFLTIGDWLTASVAIERAVAASKGTSFDKQKSQKIARWVIVGVVIFSFGSSVYDPIHRELINDEEEQRTWCVVRYSLAMKMFDLTVKIVNSVIPFCINLISAKRRGDG